MEKYVKIPWMFAALFAGIVFSALGVFGQEVGSSLFQGLATIGMFSLLFMIGYGLDLGRIRKLARDITVGTMAIIGLEGLLGTALLYLGFPSDVGGSLIVALIVAFSFATVGEAILMPILSEFKVVNTVFGQLTLGIGVLDDLIEVLMLLLLAVFSVSSLSVQTQSFLGPLLDGVAVVAVIVAGIVVRRLLKDRIERPVNFVSYGVLCPLFFLSVGAHASVQQMYPLLVLAILVVANGSKCFASYALFRKRLGAKYSLLMGVGLSVRFSTSLVVQLIMYQAGYISLALYSSLIATAIILKPIIIAIYSWTLSNSRKQLRGLEEGVRTTRVQAWFYDRSIRSGQAVPLQLVNQHVG